MKNSSASFIVITLLLSICTRQSIYAQAPTLKCPSNLTVSLDPGACTTTIYQDFTPSIGNGTVYFAIQTGGPVARQSLQSWGGNRRGQLGFGSSSIHDNIGSPSTLGTANWTEISVGGSHTLAIRKDGKLFAWGKDNYGQLGDGGTNTSKYSPVQIGTDTDWIAIETGDAHSLALKSNGKIYAWGRNLSGQLGDGNNTDQNTPVQVGIATDWIAISAGAYFSVAIKTDGSMYAWGQNNDGQLGIGNSTSQNTPTRIGTANDWVKVAAGGSHVLALKSSGHLHSWGNDFNGQLGDGGANSNTNSPAQVGSATWTDIAVGDFHSFAINGGSLYAWGRDDLGQLGDGGSNSHKGTPTRIGSYGDWKRVTGGNNHSLGIRGDGLLYAWGSNNNNKLGIGAGAGNQGSPVQVGTNGGSAKIAAGYTCSAAIQHSYSLHKGVYPFSYVVFDVAGNSGICAFALIVEDNVPPTITCPADLILPNDPGQCNRVVTYSIPGSQDNCGATTTSLANGKGSGSTYPIGTSQETYTTTDASGNTASCSFSITIQDNEIPSITCPANIVLPAAPGQCYRLVNYTFPQGVDNCFNGLQTYGMIVPLIYPVGSSQVTYTTTDASGNSASCSFTVTIEDHEPPGITCPSNMTFSNTPGQCNKVVNYTAPVGTDNCSSPTTLLTSGKGSGGTFDVGTSQETYTVTDASGNTASCSFMITIEDTELPAIKCPGSITTDTEPGTCRAKVTYITPVGTDNCGSTTAQTGGLGGGSFFPKGINTETFTVTDAHGNSASCSFRITVEDAASPVITLQGDNPVILCQYEVYTEAGAQAQDICDGDLSNQVQIDPGNLDTNQPGTYQVQYSVADAAGNQATAVNRTVIVKPQPAQFAPQNCGSCSQVRFDFCEGAPSPDLEALLSHNAHRDPNASILWYADANNTQGPSITTPGINTSTKKTRFYWVSQFKNGCEGEARRMRVRVRKTSTVVLDIPAIGCSGGQIDLAAWVSDSRNFATAYTFFDRDPDQGNPIPLGSVAATKGTVNNGQYAVVSLPSSPVTYYAVASNNTGCQVTGNDEILSGSGASLDPIPSFTVNPGDPVHISFSSPDATHILWFNHTRFNNPYIGLLGSLGSGNLIFNAYNATSSPISATLRAIAYDGNCAGEVRDFTITINPGTNNRQSQNQLSFAASKVNAHDVQLDWNLISDFEFMRFEIEKKRNEGEFERIGTKDWKGNNSYSFVDQSGMGNVNQYRLKLIFADGRVVWSEVAKVNMDFVANKRFVVFPNPNAGQFQVKALIPVTQNYHWQLSDGMGKIVVSGKTQSQLTTINIDQLSSGIYHLMMVSPHGKRYLMKVVKK